MGVAGLRFVRLKIPLIGRAAVVARVGAAHLAAAVPKADWASGLAVGELFQSDTGVDPCPPCRGEIHLPIQPGLGLPASWSRA